MHFVNNGNQLDDYLTLFRIPIIFKCYPIYRVCKYRQKCMCLGIICLDNENWVTVWIMRIEYSYEDKITLLWSLLLHVFFYDARIRWRRHSSTQVGDDHETSMTAAIDLQSVWSKYDRRFHRMWRLSDPKKQKTQFQKFIPNFFLFLKTCFRQLCKACIS